MSGQLDGGQSKTLLVGFVNEVKREMDEIIAAQGRISDILKQAKGAGFEPVKIREVCRWLCKVDKHGRDKVDESEAIFDLYRAVVAGGAGDIADMMDSARDRALLNIFAPEDQAEKKLNRRRTTMRAAMALATAAQMARKA